MRKTYWALWAFDVNILEPLMIQPSLAEAAVGLLPVVTGQIALGPERMVDVHMEVLAGLAVVADHLVGDERRQERSGRQEGLLVDGEVDVESTGSC
jgi:hypothetical protein